MYIVYGHSQCGDGHAAAISFQRIRAAHISILRPDEIALKQSEACYKLLQIVTNCYNASDMSRLRLRQIETHSRYSREIYSAQLPSCHESHPGAGTSVLGVSAGGSKR